MKLGLREQIAARLRKEEGSVKERGRHVAYRCPGGRLTVGYGRHLEDRGLSEYEAAILLNSDIAEILDDIWRIFPNFEHMSDSRKEALADMRFQLGFKSFRSFTNMIAAVRRSDWDRAADECLDSEYAREDAPERAARNAELLRKG